MNPKEQQTHRTAIRTLEKRCDDVQTLLLGLIALGRAVEARQDAFGAFVTMSRWQRLRWLVGL